jgi:ATP diphosphatase
LVARLRGPEGCPWDRAQDYRSMWPQVLCEAYEVADAARQLEPDGLRDELGDLLFHIVFLARLAQEENRFNFDQVVEAICEKLVRRHPHVFGDARASTPEEALRNWTTAKELERRSAASPRDTDHIPSVLDGIPESLPATLMAHQLGVRAAELGFDWKHPADVLAKIEEELSEVRRVLGDAQGRVAAREQLEEELGDFLFAAASLVRHLGSDAETCLRRANQKFASRFRALERRAAEQGRRLADCTADELEVLWNQVKQEE